MDAQESSTAAWGSDFFGTLNGMPPEPVVAIGGVLEAMRTEPALQEARRTMLQDLGLARGGHVLDAGCGTAAALPDLLEILGPEGRVVGIDPTTAFVAAARELAQRLGATAARYEIGDIRNIPFSSEEFDAAFCDKILIHAGPAVVALAELARVTRPGGRVGAVEWLPYFAVSTSRPDLATKMNDIFRRAVYDFGVSVNLVRYFHEAGLSDVQARAYLAHADSLDAHPFWRAFLVQQMPLFVQAGLISEEDGNAVVADLEALSSCGEFSASFVVQSAVGTKPA